MREFLLAVSAVACVMVFHFTVIYPGLEVKGYSNNKSCTGECYREYVATYGTVVQQLQAKQLQAASDPFSSVRGLWAGCAACHGQNGEGMAVFPALAGSSADYIIEALTIYKNKGTRNAMSSTMWAQAGQLSEAEIQTLAELIETEYK
ncbi:MAG: cytochrome C [Pelagibacteraceae bacterium TMED247]|nr:MAG: cytochrome C [Pelagibacteraceae bacterium TMED247]|tara:strand:+ start:6203 stop:6646 length:444 start_codon:yes stop_codon:yes gene_type:complete